MCMELSAKFNTHIPDFSLNLEKLTLTNICTLTKTTVKIKPSFCTHPSTSPHFIYRDINGIFSQLIQMKQLMRANI